VTTALGQPAAASAGGVRLLAVAPMMDRTDRHFRALLRAIARRPVLYTEMITTGAILRGGEAGARGVWLDHLLGFDPVERPLALQLGGDSPADLAACARLAEERGYDEVNLNVGCPSARVQEGSFGVCLMARPERVAEAVAAMRAATRLPVTVKHRIGFDDHDRYEDMAAFVTTVAAAGCRHFTVHARKAWLRGLSPKENREAPPLRYEDVYRLKSELPALAIEINGGVRGLAQVRRHLARVDSVMIGRAAYEDPYSLAAADAALFGDPGPPPSRREVVEAMLAYLERQLAAGVPFPRLTRHLHGLFQGQPGARAWRRRLAGDGVRRAGPELVREALAALPAGVLDTRPAVPSLAAGVPA
jgi:tRNA-dihydrouridine synthase A